MRAPRPLGPPVKLLPADRYDVISYLAHLSPNVPLARMKILLLTDKFAPELGGSQIILANAYAQLREHEVTVLTREAPGAPMHDTAYGHRIVRIPWPQVPKLRSALFAARLRSLGATLCASQGFDQIHSGQPLETAPVGTYLAKRFGIPSVIHTFAEDVTSFERHPLFGPPMRRALRRATAVSTISRYTMQRLIMLGVPDARIRLMYPGLHPEKWAPRSGTNPLVSELGLEGKRVLLTVSRLIPRKGHDMVLKALPKVLEAVPNAVYLIVGDGPERSRLERLADKLQVRSSVRFVGSIDNSATFDYYHCCDVFVMPNRRMPNGDIEGFGLVFLEANACGKPVLGGASGGAVDAIIDGETGFLVTPDRVHEITDRLILLLTNPDLARGMGEAGRARVHQSFTWAHCGDALREVITSTARG